MNLDDTIVAIATPAGRGGIGVVRLSGPDARKIALPMLRLKQELEPGRAVFGELMEVSDEEEVKIPTLSRQKTPGQGWGSRRFPMTRKHKEVISGRWPAISSGIRRAQVRRRSRSEESIVGEP